MMTWTSLAAALVVGATLCACAGSPAPVGKAAPVSSDYAVIGNASGIRGFVYGARTVLELTSPPLRLAIQDENGVPVSYEREGRYYRLSRKLERFTVWINTRTLTFSSVTARTLVVLKVDPLPAGPAAFVTPSNEVAASTVPAGIADAASKMAPTTEDDAGALVRLAATQLDEVRRAIVTGAASTAEAKALHARLDRIEAQLITAASTMVRVQFDTASTEFHMDEQSVRTLVPAARAARRINIRGRTDARIAGPADARIALGRALAARQFLVERGVEGRKIKVFSLAAGRFLAPDGSEEGRALNRRVEIELVHRESTQMAMQVRRQAAAS